MLFRLAITDPGRAAIRMTFNTVELMIGRSRGNHVVLPNAAVSKRHARLVIKDRKFIIVDLKSINGTLFNGRKINSPFVVKPADRIEIAGYQIAIEPIDVGAPPPAPIARDATEVDLLACIARCEPGCRIVYADWLEQRGDHERAEWVRIEDGGHAASSRDRALDLDVHWRVVVARAAIEGCDEPACPREWGALPATSGTIAVRTCTTCTRAVTYCTDIETARERCDAGGPVAIDATVARHDHDLSTTCPSCGGNSRRRVGFCQICGVRFTAPYRPFQPIADDDLEPTGEWTIA